MKAIERYQYLKLYWKKILEEAKANLVEASENYELWSNKLAEAEIAEKLVEEKNND